MVPPSHINPTILSSRDETFQPRNTTMTGRARYCAFILEIPWRDNNAHTMHRLAGFLSWVFLCSLRLNIFSFGIALDIAGVLRSHGK
jgi:hypothetical protein